MIKSSSNRGQKFNFKKYIKGTKNITKNFPIIYYSGLSHVHLKREYAHFGYFDKKASDPPSKHLAKQAMIGLIDLKYRF
jgi:hypothetical protein